MRAALLVMLLPSMALALNLMEPLAMPHPSEIHAAMRPFMTGEASPVQFSASLNTAQLPVARHFPAMSPAVNLNGLGDHVKVNGQSGASVECENAVTALFQTFSQGACAATFSNVNNLFNPPQNIKSNFTEQNIRVQNYCTGSCRTSANAAIATVVSTCTPTEIDLFEAWSILQNLQNPTNAFRLRALLWAINLPCVVDPNDANHYCLIDFIKLGQLVNRNNGVYTNADLDPAQGGICSVCTVKFYAFLTAYSPRAQLLLWRPIFLICLKDLYYNDANPPVLTPTYCLPEVSAINTLIDQEAKFTRLCRTRCFQKIITAAFALGLADVTNATALEVAQNAMKAMDGLCARNPAGELCFPKILKFTVVDNGFLGMFAPAPQGGGCFNTAAGQGLCPQSCKDWLNTNFVNQLGCCWNTFMALATRYGDTTNTGSSVSINGGNGGPRSFTDILSQYCGIDMPDRCPRPSKQVRLVLRLNNIAWAWVIATSANYERFREAVRADMAAFFGAAVDDTDASALQAGGGAAAAFKTGAFQLPSRRAANGFRTLTVNADAGTDAVVNLRFDSDGAVVSAKGAAAAAFADGTLDLTNVADLPTASKQDPAAGDATGFSASASASTETTANYDSPAAGLVPSAVSSLMVVIFALIALLF